MVVIAIRLRNRIMRVRLVILKLVGVVLFECRVEIFLLVGAWIMSVDRRVCINKLHLLLAQKAAYQHLLLLAMP
jgi:hypothetical protein